MIAQRAGKDDAAEILALQRLAYRSEALLYNDFGIAPLRQTLPEMEADLAEKLVLTVSAGGRIIGSVRAHVDGGTCCIGRLIVHPDHQDRGLGTFLVKVIEERFPHAGRFELFTGHRSVKNLHLYAKLGYRPFREEPVSEALTLVYLEKTISPPIPPTKRLE